MQSHLLLLSLCCGTLVSCYPIVQESGTPSTAADLATTAAAPSLNTRAGDYPYAEKTSTPGIVISPYEPYNVFDVSGLRPGTLALDTSCDKKFRIPES
jgi:hypothetical protein